MCDCADAARLPPLEVRRELAAILARGVLRLRQRRRAGIPAPKTAPKSTTRGLEVPAKTVLSVSTRVNAPESLEP
jgi:hypothetical protein